MVGLRVEEEVVFLNAALEAAVVQNQLLLPTRMVQRQTVTAGTLLLRLKLLPTLLGFGTLPLQTATLLHLPTTTGLTSLGRIHCLLFRPKNPSLPLELHPPPPNQVDGPDFLRSQLQLQLPRRLQHHNLRPPSLKNFLSTASPSLPSSSLLPLPSPTYHHPSNPLRLVKVVPAICPLRHIRTLVENSHLRKMSSPNIIWNSCQTLLIPSRLLLRQVPSQARSIHGLCTTQSPPLGRPCQAIMPAR